MTFLRRSMTTRSLAFWSKGALAATVVLAVGFAAIAEAQKVDAIAPLSTVRILDATGKVVGYPVEMSSTRFVIAVKPASDPTDNDPILLEYTISKKTANGAPIGRWNVEGQSEMFFDGPNCTGQAYIRHRDDVVVRRVAAVSKDNRLWVSSDVPTASRPSISASEANGYDGEFRCITRGIPAPERDPLVPVFLVGDLDDIFIPPFNTSTLAARLRAVR
jgi:hypothetical protein